MFKIGEFARIAHINAKLLRHYDQIDLFKPAHVDPENGYRYYHIEQLADINRIVALRELDFSLEQIKILMQEQISPQEIRGMLIMRKAQIERALEADHQRLRHVETRLHQIEHHGSFLQSYDIVVKPVSEQPILAVRHTFPNFSAAVDLFQTLASTEHIHQLGPFICLNHNENFSDDEPVDFEMGYTIEKERDYSSTAIAGIPLSIRHLPPCEQVASLVQTEDQASHHISAALGLWLDNNNHQMAGAWREIYYELSPQVIEHQVPIIRRAS